jgi:uncharacterized coiled-coil protein SlyX
MRTLEDALNRLRAEFLEMPGMHLRPEQVQRLCGVERGLCHLPRIDRLEAQLAAQQAQIDQLRELLAAQPTPLAAPASGLDIASRPSTPPPGSQEASPEPEKPAALRFRIGTVDITPIGFMDFTAVSRDANMGSGIATNFGAVPFSDTVNGNLHEHQFSAQNSRIALRFDTKVKGATLLGYLETDFLGIVPGNVAVSANSDTLRLRLFWADLRKGKFEFLAGQSWSLLTPNRKGLSPLPGDVFVTQAVDPNLHVGLTWTRSPQLRFMYHHSETVHLGVSVEASEQFAGGASGSGAITLPKDLAASYGSQLNTGSGNYATPNPHQDVVGKIAFEPKAGNRSLHLEVGGVLTRFAFFNPLTSQHFDAAGGGGSVNVNIEVVKNLRVAANTFFSAGAGRYIFGLGPDVIIQGDGSPSLVHSTSTVDGLEYQATKNLAFYGYYGLAYFDQNVAVDPADGEPVGFGYTGSPSNHNRSIQQGTFGFSQMIARDPSYGGLQWGVQYSYLVREPWYVAPGQPDSAHLIWCS